MIYVFTKVEVLDCEMILKDCYMVHNALLIVLLVCLLVSAVLSSVLSQVLPMWPVTIYVKSCSVQMWTGYLLQEGSKKKGLSPESSHLYQILLFYCTQVTNKYFIQFKHRFFFLHNLFSFSFSHLYIWVPTLT